MNIPVARNENDNMLISAYSLRYPLPSRVSDASTLASDTSNRTNHNASEEDSVMTTNRTELSRMTIVDSRLAGSNSRDSKGRLQRGMPITLLSKSKHQYHLGIPEQAKCQQTVDTADFRQQRNA